MLLIYIYIYIPIYVQDCSEQIVESDVIPEWLEQVHLNISVNPSKIVDGSLKGFSLYLVDLFSGGSENHWKTYQLCFLS